MSNLGEGHFAKPLKPLDGEKVLWEGSASKKSILVSLLRLFVPIIIFVITVYALWSTNLSHHLKESMTQELEVSATEVIEQLNDSEKQNNPYAAATAETIIETMLLMMGLLGFGVFVSATFGPWLRCRSSWYIVTNERVCIQSGALSKNLTILDLDKIISVKDTSGWLERKLGFHSIELMHAGNSVAPRVGLMALLSNHYTMQFVPYSEDILSKLTNEWLPRDNRGHCMANGG
jgi:uncharacterized membrane protein YdbT with pleckstrin-like domain